MTNEELVLSYQEGNKRALDKLIEQNTGIVYKIARKFNLDKINSIDEEDLISEGYIGLIKAANSYRFDMENRASFVTYAVYWIYQSISKFLNKRKTNNEVSINKPVGIEEDAELGDCIESVDYSFEDIEEQIYLKQIRELIENAMAQVNSLRELDILKLKYGWNSKPMPIKDISQILECGVTKMSQLEYHALRKLRNCRTLKEKAGEFAELGYISKFYLDIVLKNTDSRGDLL